jgi:hypothetical protein
VGQDNNVGPLPRCDLALLPLLEFGLARPVPYALAWFRSSPSSIIAVQHLAFRSARGWLTRRWSP